MGLNVTLSVFSLSDGRRSPAILHTELRAEAERRELVHRSRHFQARHPQRGLRHSLAVRNEDMRGTPRLLGPPTTALSIALTPVTPTPHSPAPPHSCCDWNDDVKMNILRERCVPVPEIEKRSKTLSQ